MSVKLTAEEEIELARRVREQERLARVAIEGISEEADAILRRRPSRSERTRAGAVDRLIEAVAACASNGVMKDDKSRRSVEAAQRHLAVAHDLCWQLAMSAERVASGEANKLASPFMSQEDLMQAGFIGLLQAAKRFDPDRGIRFSTYASWWVKATQIRAIETTGRPIRLPGGVSNDARRVRQAVGRFERAGIDYTIGELAKEVEFSISKVELLLGQGVVSLDSTDLSLTLEGEGAETTPDLNAMTRQALERMTDAFAEILDERERDVLTRHYGLSGTEESSMADIAKSMGLSRERVRQIEVRTLSKLRDSLSE